MTDDLAIRTIQERTDITETRFPSLSMLGSTFLESLDCSDSSKRTYAGQLKEFFNWIDLSRRSPILTTWKRQDIIEYKKFLKNSLRVPKSGGNALPLAPNTVDNYLSIVRKLWTWLEQEGICINIAGTVKGIGRQNGYRKHTLSKGQIRDALATFDLNTLNGLRDFAILNLMVRTGSRDCEITRAKVKHLRTISGHSVLDVHAKGHNSADQYKVLTDETERPIRAYLEARKAIASYNDEDYLFVSHARRNYMQGLTTRSISRIIKKALREIGLDDEKLTAHSLRHTAITLAVAGGASLHQAQAMAGHKDSRTTEIYFHNVKRLEEAAEKFIDF